MIIDLQDDLPSIDVVSEPGRVLVRTSGRIYREWGRISCEGGEHKYPGTVTQETFLEVDMSTHQADAERWRVDLGRGRSFEFYFTTAGITCASSDDDHGVGFHVRCPVSSFSGWVEGSDDGQPRFDRVG